MEKKNAPAAVASEPVASEAVATVEAAAVLVKATVPASDEAAGASADAACGKIRLADWDPYEEEEYIRPENPFDTSLADPWTEVISLSCLLDQVGDPILARSLFLGFGRVHLAFLRYGSSHFNPILLDLVFRSSLPLFLWDPYFFSIPPSLFVLRVVVKGFPS